MDEFLELKHFEPHVGKVFHFKPTLYALPLERIISDDKPLPKGLNRRPFILIFSGPKGSEHLPEGLYDCEIEDGPTYRVYVNPIFTPRPDQQEYQAVFS